MNGGPPSTAFALRQIASDKSWPGLGKMRVASHGSLEKWLESQRTQLPLWLPVMLGIGIAAWFALPKSADWMAWVAASLSASLFGHWLLPAGGRARQCAVLAGLLMAAGCILAWGRAEWVRAAVLARPAVVSLSADVLDLQRQPALGRVRMILRPLARDDVPPRIRVAVDDDALPAGVDVGARIALRARLMPPAPPAVPGAYDFARAAWFMRLGATGRLLGDMRVERAAPARGAGIRHRLTAHILSRLPQAEGGIAAAFVTGDEGGIDETDAEAMRRSGLAHLLSISGLHVSAVIAAAFFLTLRLLALSPRLALNLPLVQIAAGAGALAGVGYTWLAGAEVPTIRSCVGALLVLGAMVIGREALSLRLVATGALLVLLLWPEALVGPSFQLSFAAVIALVALHESPWARRILARRDEGRVRAMARSLFGLLLSGLVIELVLMPIALFHFHRAGMLGALANLIAIPLTTFVIMPLEAMALALDMAGLGEPLWWLTGKAIALLLMLARTVAALPGASAALPIFPDWAFALAVGGMLWAALWRGRVRFAGIVPLAVGLGAMLAAPAPDLLVTGDGRHVAVRTADGGLALLREKAGEYVRDMLGQSAGFDGEAGALTALPMARCSADLCAVDLRGGGRTWRVLVTRSRERLRWADMVAACAASDVAIGDRMLPKGCQPRWLKLDRRVLSATGGVAIWLKRPHLRSVRAAGDDHPWIVR